MNRLPTSEKSILAEANRLAGNGMRNAAIEILEEYLEINPATPSLLGALGKAYLLNHQPEKAIKYLKQSLDARQLQNSLDTSQPYDANHFSDEDMEYVAFVSKDGQEEEYTYQEKSDSKVDTVSGSKSTVGIKSITGIIKPDDSAETESDATLLAEETDDHHDAVLENQESDIQLIDPNVCEEKIHDIDDVDDGHNDAATAPIGEIDDADVQMELIGLSVAELGEESLEIDEHEDYDEFVLDLDIDENLVPGLQAEDETSEDIFWDATEDLDEFDDNAQRFTEEEVRQQGKVNREERAMQVAVALVNDVGWDIESAYLLQRIFAENGWGAARVAIERAIHKGAQPEQLALARKIRIFWAGNERFWMTFHKIHSNASFQQTDDAYKNMSWVESLRIINSFTNLPDIEEIYSFIENLYQHWYETDDLRNSFKAFLNYLRYRTGSTTRALPGDCAFSFSDYFDFSDTDELDEILYAYTPQRLLLGQLGIQLAHRPKPEDNILKINPEYLS